MKKTEKQVELMGRSGGGVTYWDGSGGGVAYWDGSGGGVAYWDVVDSEGLCQGKRT